MADQGHRRTTSTLHDCLEPPPAPREARRPWFLLVITMVLLYYVYYCRIGENYSVLSKLEKVDVPVQMEDATVIVNQEISSTPVPAITELLCGANGCDFEALSKPTRKRLKNFYKDDWDTTQPCEIFMEGRGRLHWNTTKVEVELTRAQFPMIKLGGYHTPSDCQSRHKVAIIVPYRNNEKKLNVFLFNIHPFLVRQKIEYRIFIVEQIGQDDTNKGRLFNVGYEQAHRFDSWHCLVFHDVDLLPLDDRILYTCPTYPRHMSATVVGVENQMKYKLFGGVAAMSDEHFLKVNGYSNTYWGCCGVDSDMYWRIRLMGLRVVRYDKKIAVYTTLPYPPQEINDVNRHKRTSPGAGKSQYRSDGLSTVQYKVLSVQQRFLYTHVLVDLNPKLRPTPNYTTSKVR